MSEEAEGMDVLDSLITRVGGWFSEGGHLVAQDSASIELTFALDEAIEDDEAVTDLIGAFLDDFATILDRRYRVDGIGIRHNRDVSIHLCLTPPGWSRERMNQ